jgi:uncharacterized membrane protein required for colicin V production
MHLIIDTALIVVIVLFALKHYRIGFFCSVLNVGRFIVATALAALFRAPVAALIMGLIFEGGESTPVANMLSGMIAFVLIFVLVVVISGLIIRAISNIKIPIITDFDKWLGLALGAILGVITASVVSTALYSVLEFISGVRNSPELMEIYEHSFVFKLIYGAGVFEFIRNLI